MTRTFNDFYEPYRRDPNLLGLLVRSRILKAPLPEDAGFIRTLISRMRRRQRLDGSVDGSVVETCQVLRRFSALGVSGDETEVESAVNWLRSLVEGGASLVRAGKNGQRFEGSVIPVPPGERDAYCSRELRMFERDTLGGKWPAIRAAFASGLAFPALEIEALFRYDSCAEKPEVTKMIELVMSLQAEDGSWPASRARGRIASTVFGLRALCGSESYTNSDAAGRAINFLSEHQAPSGHFMVRRSAGGSKKSIGVAGEGYLADTISRFPGEQAREILRKLGGSLLVKRRVDGTWGRGPDRYLPTWRIVAALSRAGIIPS